MNAMDEYVLKILLTGGAMYTAWSIIAAVWRASERISKQSDMFEAQERLYNAQAERLENENKRDFPKPARKKNDSND